ncbi:MAG: HAD hydrolase-like protein [Gemmatimonadales bacterium]|nr:HAD hydrolase-like protein [Gemmatimonadales bacterium]
MALNGIIFDIDGTLVDSNAVHVEAWRSAFEAYGYRIGPDRITVEVGKGGDRLVPAILGQVADARDGDALRKRQRSAYLEAVRRDGLAVFPRVPELFAALRARGLRSALATSSDPGHLQGTMASAGLDLAALADEVVTSEEAESSKPAPDLVTAAVRKLGLSPAQCAMVGDTVYDACAATAAGVVALGVLSGGNPAPALLRAGARAVWRDTGHLLEDLECALVTGSPGERALTREVQETLMRAALESAEAGLRAGEVPIGAVIARGDGRIVARGFNEMRRSGNPTAHAEMIAFAHAAGMVPPAARDVLLVSTLEPCVMCTGAAMETAVDSIIFGLRAPADNGSSRVRPPAGPDNQMPRIVGDVLADESRRLFTEWLRVNGNAEQRPFVELLLRQT